jgi:hypothetical protein
LISIIQDLYGGLYLQVQTRTTNKSLLSYFSHIQIILAN